MAERHLSATRPILFWCWIRALGGAKENRCVSRRASSPAEPVSPTLTRDLLRVRPASKLNLRGQTDPSVPACCSMARVGHSAMTSDELTENIEAAVKAVAAKLRMVSVARRVLHSFTWGGGQSLPWELATFLQWFYLSCCCTDGK